MAFPKSYQITLTDKQRHFLDASLAKRSTPRDHIYRTQIILAAAEGKNNKQIMKQYDLSRQTVVTWRKRWHYCQTILNQLEEEGDDKILFTKITKVLSDNERSGAPLFFEAQQVCQILTIALEPPEKYDRPISHWSRRELAEESMKQGIVESISPSSIGRFLKSGGFKTPQNRLLDGTQH